MYFRIFSYFIWTGDSQLFSFAAFSLKWNAILLILGFLVCRQLLFYIYQKEKGSLNEVAWLSVYVVVVTLIASRLGHELIYEPERVAANFPSIFLPFEFDPDFHLLGRGKFSIHGAAIGILFFLWLYGRRNKEQDYLQRLDRVSIAAALSGVFILIGSFLSSDLTGKPTASSTGVIFIKPVLNGLLKVPCCIMRSPDGKNPLENIDVKKDPASLKTEKHQKSIVLYLFFKPGPSEQLVNEFLIGDVKTYLYDMAQFVHEPGTEPLHYRIFIERNNQYTARITTKGIARYPVQLFEAISCAALFLFLFSYWRRHKIDTKSGRLFGYFMILFWSLQLAFGFMKEKQASVEIGLNILLVLAGITILVVSGRKHSTKGDARQYPTRRP
ncbi:MAG: prolipoprotein diacylglyceryl transferase family protein [Cyclobacteriaceae bacterium]